MNTAPAPAPAPRIAIVGSTSPLGKELRRVLEEWPAPWRLAMLETDAYAGLLQEFGGEIEIVQVISPERLEDADVAVFACSPELLDRYIELGAYLPPVTLDLTGGPRDGPVFVDGVSRPRPSRTPETIIAPRGDTVVIARVLDRLHGAAGVDGCEATILESASERGGAAMDRLQEETVQVLNFNPGAETSSQQAFNILGPDSASDGRAARIARQIGSVSRNGCPAPAIQIVSVPVFQGGAISMHVRLREELTADELERLLTTDSMRVRSEAARTPLEALGSADIHLSSVREAAGDNAFWMWIVTDNLRVAAANAVRLIRNATSTPS